MRDMFGNEVAIEEARRRKSLKSTPKKGYSAPPGTGPSGETCKTCKHLYRNRMAKTYLKCELMRSAWTGGAGTDVLASAPACRNWEAKS